MWRALTDALRASGVVEPKAAVIGGVAKRYAASPPRPLRDPGPGMPAAGKRNEPGREIQGVSLSRARLAVEEIDDEGNCGRESDPGVADRDREFAGESGAAVTPTAGP